MELMEMPNKTLLRVDEAAAVLAVSPDQIRIFLQNGTLRGKCVNANPGAGRRYMRVLTASIKDFLDDERRDA